MGSLEHIPHLFHFKCYLVDVHQSEDASPESRPTFSAQNRRSHGMTVSGTVHCPPQGVFTIPNINIQHQSYLHTLSMSQLGPQAPPLINLSGNSILSGGNFTQHNQIYNVRKGERDGYARLAEHAAPNALHDSGHVVDPPKCHPNTRVAIIQTVIDWSSGTTVDKEMNAKAILWLKGGAGAGKSAIARSVAERTSKEGLLLGTFFFGAGDATRNHVGGLVATLAYQICSVLPKLREVVTSFIEDDPLIFSRSLSAQFTTLLIRPLSIIFANHSGSTQIPRLVIIDGLDECTANIDSQRDLLFTLLEVTSSTSLIRFLVCSRPESHLNDAFSSARMANTHYKIFLDADYSAREDIELYLKDKFRGIKEGHVFKHKLPTTWPSPDIIRNLAYESSGQFIYAATVVRYIQSPRHRPDQRLDAILNLRPPFKDLPFTELDALYRHIISKADDLSIVLNILAFPVLYGSFDVTYLEKMLHLEEGDVEVILADLQSLITILDSPWWDPGKSVKLLHKSLTDFLCDSQRAGDLYQDYSAVRVQHITRSIDMVSTTFKHGGIQALDDTAICLASASKLLTGIRQESPGSIHNLNGTMPSNIYSDFLQAARQLPTFDLIKQYFLPFYLERLRSDKDIQESARLIYLQHIRLYCDAVLSLLEDELSNDWKAHFVLPWKSMGIRKFLRWDRGTFCDFVYRISLDAELMPGSWSLDNYFSDILEISNDLTKGTKREAILALSASFCVAFLCDNRSTTADTRHIFKYTGIDQRRRREHPWRWRRMIPRRRSLGNQPVIMKFGPLLTHDHAREHGDEDHGATRTSSSF
ncbi:hypothetical protein D9613_004493 [Agrocybe pediades]|uniref:Nephrocystin 3-like N-terminal domain-containing protein n=1 Tax=Agrocybe pediades TaxID=84607 RepID=A0A8H4QIT4_9AGAR|nr:hypothetical protein D9613_004493 [Agrocybe pediades]